MPIDRRQMLLSLAAGLAAVPARRLSPSNSPLTSKRIALKTLLRSSGEVDWRAVRELFPLAPDWTHLASFSSCLIHDRSPKRSTASDESSTPIRYGSRSRPSVMQRGDPSSP